MRYGWCKDDAAPFAVRAREWRAATPPLALPRMVRTVLVPCAGADVLTPRTLFPNATRLVLVSREPVGDGVAYAEHDERNATLECTRVGGYMIGVHVRSLARREGMLPMLRAVADAAGLHVRRVVWRVAARWVVLVTAEGVRVEYVQDDAVRFLRTWPHATDDCAVLVKGDEWVFARDNASAPYRACATVVREGVHHHHHAPFATTRVFHNLTTRFGYCVPDPFGRVTGQHDRAERGQRLRCDLTVTHSTRHPDTGSAGGRTAASARSTRRP